MDKKIRDTKRDSEHLRLSSRKFANKSIKSYRGDVEGFDVYNESNKSRSSEAFTGYQEDFSGVTQRVKKIANINSIVEGFENINSLPSGSA